MEYISTTILIRKLLHRKVIQCIPLFASVYLRVLLPLRMDPASWREARCKLIHSVQTVRRETCVHSIQTVTVLFFPMEALPEIYKPPHHLISATEQSDPFLLNTSHSPLNQAHLTLIPLSGIPGLLNIQDIITLPILLAPEHPIQTFQRLPPLPLPQATDQHRHLDQRTLCLITADTTIHILLSQVLSASTALKTNTTKTTVVPPRDPPNALEKPPIPTRKNPKNRTFAKNATARSKDRVIW
jgi:hypothetical protein